MATGPGEASHDGELLIMSASKQGTPVRSNDLEPRPFVGATALRGGYQDGN